ncbi:MAG: DUF2975 domain-containing protein [Lachnospiraceae bacterium]|nr:DUF2975 domain-containing protein [Lachnospiraceae bacterium]
MESLNTIQTLARIGKILSKIVFIFCIVGLCLTVAGIISYAVLGDGAIKIGGVSLKSFIETEAGINAPTMFAYMAVGCVGIIAEMILSRMAVRYFENELEDGTPFTERGAGELKRLGIFTIVLPIAVMIVCAIGVAIASAVNGDISVLHLGGSADIGLGIMMIVMSVVCRYGTALREEAEGKDIQDRFTV